MAATRTQLEQLAAPFELQDIEWRVQSSGEKNGRPWARVIVYVTSRAIMQRLDDVVGPENWRNDFRAGPAGGVVCALGIRCEIPDADGVARQEWVTKWDGASNSDVEAVKGGLSSAQKRAAVQWGIGRYLYDIGELWADVKDTGRFSAKTKDGKWFKWDPPTLPEWAVPSPAPATEAQLAELQALLREVRDERVAASVSRRLAQGLTEAGAVEALRFVKQYVKTTSARTSASAAAVPDRTPADGQGNRVRTSPASGGADAPASSSSTSAGASTRRAAAAP